MEGISTDYEGERGYVMSDTSRARPLAETLAAMAALTPAQHALLERISHHATPVTVAELAQEAGLHVSSVRETLEGLFALGLVEKQQLPSSGRGRPALGYSTMTPADPSFAAQMLHQLTSSLLAWLRVDAADPVASVREIGSPGRMPPSRRWRCLITATTRTVAPCATLSISRRTWARYACS